MAITVPQIPAALLTVTDLQAKLNDMRLLLAQAKELSDKNWQTDIGSRFPLILTVSPAQQAAMVGAYDALKTALVSTFQQLP
jgi:hypothetical protein